MNYTIYRVQRRHNYIKFHRTTKDGKVLTAKVQPISCPLHTQHRHLYEGDLTLIGIYVMAEMTGNDTLNIIEAV